MIDAINVLHLEMAAIILKILLIILLMGLLVMTFLMFGAVACDLFKIIRNRKYGRKRKNSRRRNDEIKRT